MHAQRSRALPLGAGLLLLLVASPASTEVYVFESDTKALADIGIAPSPPYLLSSSGSGQDYWWTPSASDPSALSNGTVVESLAEAVFVHPYDNVPISPSFTAQTTGILEFSARHGALWVSAGASASAFPSSFVALPSEPWQSPIEIDNPYLAGSFAGAWLGYDDSLTIASATLPAGHPVQLEIDVFHSGATQSTAGLGGGPPYPNHALSETTFEVAVYAPGGSTPKEERSVTLRSESVTGEVTSDGPRQQAYVIPAAVGDQLWISQTLRVWARATAYADASVAASESANGAAARIGSGTAGAELVADSGEVYVPEPYGPDLQWAALLSLAAWSGRRHCSSSAKKRDDGHGNEAERCGLGNRHGIVGAGGGCDRPGGDR